LQVWGLRENAAAISMMGKRINRIPLQSAIPLDAKKALAVPGSYLDVFTALMCTQLQIRYEKLSEQERTVLKNVMKKTPAYKDSPLSRMKRR